MGEVRFGRRRFLALTAAAGAAVAGTGLLGEPLAEAATAVDYAGLKRALTGPLLRPGDTGYATAAKPYNSALGVRKPAAIAKVAGADDVRTCVRRVRGHGVPLAARAGGHSYAGFSTPDNGVVVDLSALKGITVTSDGTAVVGAGVKLIDLYSALAAHGRALPAGSCPTVGVAGSTLGGGIGVVARTYGLTCDHLKSATVVTADGALHTVDGNHDADLFWALRGGGGGNGGIVTSFTFGTVPAPTVTIFSLRFPASRTSRVLRAWSQWMDAAPDRLTSLCAVTAASTPTNRVTGTWTGSAPTLAAHLSALITAVGANPTSRTTHTYDYLSAMKYFAGCLGKTISACHAGGHEAFRAASRMLDRTVTSSIADRVVALMSRQQGMVLLFDSLRGQVGRVGTADTAFAHRGAHASVQVYSGNAANGPAVLAVQQALAPIVGSGAYVNYLNPGQKDWASAYYGANLPRLRQVIRRYDPDRVFDFPQSVLRA
ncbi:FAD-binding oxidoreductase [Krasilnikovia sp. MM14-A1004]|uniref:FAD-binding oxidoreductase n=1 Tax=Krasilnikovia sp. MM14-A1004 TaxID=3373541 RepID=UPI00399D22EC